jgi:hypothetical protein
VAPSSPSAPHSRVRVRVGPAASTETDLEVGGLARVALALDLLGSGGGRRNGEGGEREEGDDGGLEHCVESGFWLVGVERVQVVVRLA